MQPSRVFLVVSLVSVRSADSGVSPGGCGAADPVGPPNASVLQTSGAILHVEANPRFLEIGVCTVNQSSSSAARVWARRGSCSLWKMLGSCSGGVVPGRVLGDAAQAPAPRGPSAVAALRALGLRAERGTE
ncbi:hypothetical protein J1605_003491 [Eschrichtius robustus]|uniref:Secreted protein n=1 Tax=Eschrichtius robustus TaxID=9764 RepID=A0AB34HRZ5_ESCRO|nr:hypothetical protein J1605_003491 [Eschrichtius robustus]